MRIAVIALVVAVGLSDAAMAIEFKRQDLTVETRLVPSPLEYSVLLPAGYEEAKEPYPLLLNLHGGRGSRDGIVRIVPALQQAVEKGSVPPMVVVMPSVTTRAFYMDFKDGSEMWETFILKEFIPHLRSTLKVRKDPAGLFVSGGSMGGMGATRLAFREPEMFAAVAALFPGIEPILAFKDMQPRHRFWRGDELFERTYGKPVDEAFWARNNPATIAAQNAERLRNSGLGIYLEAGDEDVYLLHEGTEFLHRVLFDHGIRHEYRLLQWEDHGTSYTARNLAILEFFGKIMNPPPIEERMQGSRARILPLRERVGIPSDRFVPSPPLAPTR